MQRPPHPPPSGCHSRGVTPPRTAVGEPAIAQPVAARQYHHHHWRPIPARLEALPGPGDAKEPTPRHPARLEVLHARPPPLRIRPQTTLRGVGRSGRRAFNRRRAGRPVDDVRPLQAVEHEGPRRGHPPHSHPPDAGPAAAAGGDSPRHPAARQRLGGGERTTDGRPAVRRRPGRCSPTPSAPTGSPGHHVGASSCRRSPRRAAEPSNPTTSSAWPKRSAPATRRWSGWVPYLACAGRRSPA
jgi:hypothetical protein